MPGFIAEVSKEKILTNFAKSRTEDLINGKITDGKFYYVERRTINKFLNDKVFYEDDEYVVCTEGVILNSLILQKKYNSQKNRKCQF